MFSSQSLKWIYATMQENETWRKFGRVEKQEDRKG